MSKLSGKKRIRESAGTVIFRWVIRIFLIAWSVIVAFPVIWVLYTSLKTNQEFFAAPWALPETPQWINFVNAWEKGNFGSYFFNSMFLVILTLVLTLLIVGSAAYVIAKYNNRFIRALEKFYMVAMMVPSVLLMVPLYYFAENVTMSTGIPMTDSLVFLAILYAVQGMPFSVFMLAGFVRGIHNSLLEAAEIDGANQFTIFFKIIMPLIKPSMFVVALLNVMGTWNEYVTALTFLHDETKYTIAIGLSYLTNQGQYDVDYGRTFAGLVIALVPILIMYAIFQKQLQNGLSSSDGVKG